MPAAVALEAMGVLVPAETPFVTAAVLAAHGRMDIAVVIALAFHRRIGRAADTESRVRR